VSTKSSCERPVGTITGRRDRRRRAAIRPRRTGTLQNCTPAFPQFRIRPGTTGRFQVAGLHTSAAVPQFRRWREPRDGPVRVPALKNAPNDRNHAKIARSSEHVLFMTGGTVPWCREDVGPPECHGGPTPSVRACTRAAGRATGMVRLERAASGAEDAIAIVGGPTIPPAYALKQPPGWIDRSERACYRGATT
jgi:hypothetical protein